MSDKVVRLDIERMKRRDPATRFMLLATEVSPAAFGWEWWIDDLDASQWRPTKKQIAAQLRRVADRYDPQPKLKGRRGRRR